MKKILIADDSPFMRAIMKNSLNGVKIHIIEAKDGEEAVQKFKDEKPDLMTLDITMPKKTGIEVLKEIVRDFPSAKILICSSMVNKRIDKEVKQEGAMAFIKKPFKDSEFREFIEKHL